jgi:hypothetical protein
MAAKGILKVLSALVPKRTPPSNLSKETLNRLHDFIPCKKSSQRYCGRTVLARELTEHSPALLDGDDQHPLDVLERLGPEWEKAVRDLHRSGWRQ